MMTDSEAFLLSEPNPLGERGKLFRQRLGKDFIVRLPEVEHARGDLRTLVKIFAKRESRSRTLCRFIAEPISIQTVAQSESTAVESH